MGSPLIEKDVNAPVQTQDAAGSKDGKQAPAKSLEYHRQMLQSKLNEEKYGTKANATTRATCDSNTGAHAATTRVKNPQMDNVANTDTARDRQQQYISPSDNLLSPCTVKLNSLKGRAASRMRPKSLFARPDKKADADDVFGTKNPASTSDGDSKPST
ncbi:hypothetical protein GGS26DRAFT_536770 [Hypomontagnella submonticulosa]|nr:hypothetical protein GGS26DRAFT_536770 [Hypomontagnella submonticulosa]